ncbi:MAG TPA: SpvB/TcaC N-terminal domain-containing protein, partial [Anaeromyxobacteraceae bacterium]
MSALTGGSGSSGTSGVGGLTVMPDLFTGLMSHSVPIEVPPGRHGMQPNLALQYRSSNGNGWVGVGWELEMGSVERSMKGGVNYGGDAYVLRMGGAAVDLVQLQSGPYQGEYRAKIESGAFHRLRKLPASDGRTYWEVTTRDGTKYLFGQTSDARQDNPTDAGQIFKWCLDRMQDTSGNYLIFIYVKDAGQIYPSRIDYSGHTTYPPSPPPPSAPSDLLPTASVTFVTEATRSDVAAAYAINFAVTTRYRLKRIDVVASSQLVRAYLLQYVPSSSSSRSLLASLQQFGADAVLGSDGSISSGSSLPRLQFTANNGTNELAESW